MWADLSILNQSLVSEKNITQATPNFQALNTHTHYSKTETIVPHESLEIVQLKEENKRLSTLVARLSRAVHGLCTS